ncbi:UNVERIFIED_CONTAM: hypothetical protein RMT77_004740 [Armadillidium vulgare]
MASHLFQLAEQVVTSGKNVNIADTIEVTKGSGANVKSLLAVPVRNSAYTIIGVAKIINKLNNQPFDENDEHLFEAFTIFCGLGIHNTLMYNQLEKAMARQKVAIEVLSYHATASSEEVRRMMSKRIPESWEWKLGSLSFDDFFLSQDEMVLASVRMFRDLGLVSRLRINHQMLLRWLITVKRNYRNVQYHNWRHAFNVAHVMFSILTTCEMRCHLTDLETLAMFVGCLCHDLDHRGTNNAFQEKTGSALALLYGTQNTMEHHHFNHAVMILNSEGHNILSYLSSNEYSQVMTILRESILATDLTIYFQVRERFFPIVENGEFSWEIESHREMIRSLMMTACDLGAATKPWDIQRRVAEKVTSEFFEQGDLEKSTLNVTPQALMDRDRQHELPLLQMRWLKDICLPLYGVLSKVNPKLLPMSEGVIKNMILWARRVKTKEDDIPDFKEFPIPIPNG